MIEYLDDRYCKCVMETCVLFGWNIKETEQQTDSNYVREVVSTAKLSATNVVSIWLRESLSF